VFTAVGKNDLRSMIIGLVGHRIPVCASPENAARVIRSMYDYKNWRDGRPPIE
jgi:hypothetical protein